MTPHSQDRAAPALSFGPPADDAELARAFDINHRAFGLPLEVIERWLRGAGLSELRVVRPPGEGPVGCLLRMPMGHYFGGRSVRSLGFAGVAVPPEGRGRGVGPAMMGQALAEGLGEGFALSSLYASTQSLYRKLGFEAAGHSFHYRVPLVPDRPLPWKDRERRLLPARLDGSHLDEIRRLYESVAVGQNGLLDRSELLWRRVAEYRGSPYECYGLRDAAGQLHAYVYLTQRWLPEGVNAVDLHVSDLCFRDAAAGRELLAFLFDFAMIAGAMVMYGGPVHPLLVHLPQQRFTAELHSYWMLRVLDVERALESRGYPPGVATEVAFELDDDHFERNRDRFILTVEGRVGRVRRGHPSGAGRLPTLRARIGGLAPIYSGFLSARQARLAGLVDGEDMELAAFDPLFCGQAPALSDRF